MLTHDTSKAEVNGTNIAITTDFTSTYLKVYQSGNSTEYRAFLATYLPLLNEAGQPDSSGALLAARICHIVNSLFVQTQDTKVLELARSIYSRFGIQLEHFPEQKLFIPLFAQCLTSAFLENPPNERVARLRHLVDVFQYASDQTEDAITAGLCEINHFNAASALYSNTRDVEIAARLLARVRNRTVVGLPSRARIIFIVSVSTFIKDYAEASDRFDLLEDHIKHLMTLFDAASSLAESHILAAEIAQACLRLYENVSDPENLQTLETFHRQNFPLLWHRSRHALDNLHLASYLSSIGLSFRLRFERLRKTSLLRKSLLYLAQSYKISPRISTFVYATTLRVAYEETGEDGYLDASFELWRRLLVDQNKNPEDLASGDLTNFATTVWRMSERDGNPGGLAEAFMYYESAIDKAGGYTVRNVPRLNNQMQVFGELVKGGNASLVSTASVEKFYDNVAWFEIVTAVSNSHQSLHFVRTLRDLKELVPSLRYADSLLIQKLNYVSLIYPSAAAAFIELRFENLLAGAAEAETGSLDKVLDLWLGSQLRLLFAREIVVLGRKLNETSSGELLEGMKIGMRRAEQILFGHRARSSNIFDYLLSAGNVVAAFNVIGNTASVFVHLQRWLLYTTLPQQAAGLNKLLDAAGAVYEAYHSADLQSASIAHLEEVTANLQAAMSGVTSSSPLDEHQDLFALSVSQKEPRPGELWITISEVQVFGGRRIVGTILGQSKAGRSLALCIGSPVHTALTPQAYAESTEGILRNAKALALNEQCNCLLIGASGFNVELPKSGKQGKTEWIVELAHNSSVPLGIGHILPNPPIKPATAASSRCNKIIFCNDGDVEGLYLGKYLFGTLQFLTRHSGIAVIQEAGFLSSAHEGDELIVYFGHGIASGSNLLSSRLLTKSGEIGALNLPTMIKGRTPPNSALMLACSAGAFHQFDVDASGGFVTCLLAAGVNTVIAPVDVIDEASAFLFAARFVERLARNGSPLDAYSAALDSLFAQSVEERVRDFNSLIDEVSARNFEGTMAFLDSGEEVPRKAGHENLLDGFRLFRLHTTVGQ